MTVVLSATSPPKTQVPAVAPVTPLVAAVQTLTAPAADASLPSLSLLETRYLASQVPEARREIIRELGRREAVSALPLLSRLFGQEKRLELREQVLETASDFEPGTGSADPRWELFAGAAASTQPLEIRLSALQTLATFQDARVPALLERYARDSHPMIREQAARMLREISE